MNSSSRTSTDRADSVAGADSERAAGWSALFSGANRSIAIIIAVGIALHSANVYLAGAVMPSVAADIGGLSMYAWATTVFVFSAVLGSTAAATLLGRNGARGAYRTAILVVGAGTVVCAVAPSMPVLLAGRFVQGLGGGLLFALAYSMVQLVLPQRLWAVAMGLVSAMWGLGTFSGPAIGGTFAELHQWRLAFWIVVPVTLFFAAWGAARLPRDAGRQQRPPAAPLRSVGLLGSAVLVVSAASISTEAIVNGAGVLAAGVLFAVWLRHERHAARRLLPAATFSGDGRLRWLYVTMALLMVAATPEIFVAYFAQHLQGLGPLAAGYLATAMAAGWTSASLLLSGAERHRRTILAVSPLVSAAGLGLLAFVGPLHDGGAPVIASIAVGFALLGWGIGMAWPHLVTGVLETVPADEQDLAGASVTTVQLSAAAAGAAIGGTIINLAGFSDPGGVVGAHDAARCLYVAMLAAPILAFLALRRGARRDARVVAADRGEPQAATAAAADRDGRRVAVAAS
jgi:MFS family permease